MALNPQDAVNAGHRSSPDPKPPSMAPPTDRAPAHSRFAIAWAFAGIFYILEYAARSSPSVMIPELATSFGTTALGVSSVVVMYYYTYSVFSLVAGGALDRFGAKQPLTIGILTLAVGCLLFSAPSIVAGSVGRLLQGAGSAFAFTGAVYLASRGFPARYLATAIGATQCLGMIGGSAGQFAVAPMIQGGLGVKDFWIGLGILCVVNAVLLYAVTPREEVRSNKETRGLSGLFRPYKIVFTNPHSYFSGIIAGLLFAPTTIGAMIWAVPGFQKDIQLPYSAAVVAASMVPLGWVFGCPLFGWLSDRIGRRKPVIIVGALLMAIVIAQFTFSTEPLIPLKASLFILGLLSGVAMIPYSVIKEVNPDDVKGSATGAINFLVFGITSVIGPVFAGQIGKTLGKMDPIAHFREAGLFWVICCVVAAAVTFLLRETGHGAKHPSPAKLSTVES